MLLRHNLLIIRRISTSKNNFGSKKLEKLKWDELARKKWGYDHCMENFDEYYKPVFGKSWPSMRLALLSQQKYCAFLNNFADVQQSKSLMKKIGARDIRHVYNRRLAHLFNTTMSKESPEGGLTDSTLEMSARNSADYDEENEDESTFDDIEEDTEGRFASLATHQAATFNEFVPATKLRGLDDFIDETDYLYQKDTGGSFNFIMVKDKLALLPQSWRIFSYKRGDISGFPHPRSANSNVLGYYLMDMCSVLPVLALNPKSGDVILDMCAAPGGKSLAILQTLYDVNLTCNDSELSRMKRLQDVFHAFIPSSQSKNENRPKLIVSQGQKFGEQEGIYNKILVDAPCTNDRHSANTDENNIFKPTRLAERTQLPQIQAQLLSAALRAVKRGGTVVYSTCSLSPIQNDGVVHMALQQLWQETSASFAIHDLSDLFYPLASTFFFHSSPKYGQLVVPNVLHNFGPMYVCKISKV